MTPVLKLAITVVAIALPDCINPSLIGGELFVATGAHPRRRTAAFTLGAWVVTFGFGIALALGLGDLILSFLPKPGATVKYALISAAGLVLLLGGVEIWIRRRTLAGSNQSHHASHGSPSLLGAGLASLELFTAFPYFAAIALIVGAGVSNSGKLALLVLYCVVYTLPLILIAVAFLAMGDRAGGVIGPASDWFFAHWPALVAPITIVIGIAVLAFGAVQLLSA